MTRRFIFAFILLGALGFGGVAAAQTVDYDTPSPDAVTTETATPTPAGTPDAVAEETDTMDPFWIFAAGALIGAALLAVAEVSGVSYVKRHGKKK